MSQYPLKWAQSVVDCALQKHARVKESFLSFCGLSAGQLAELLADNRQEWPYLRDMLKDMDCYVHHGGNNLTSVEYRKILLKRYSVKIPKGLRLYLDKRIFRQIIEEQGNSEEPLLVTASKGSSTFGGNNGESNSTARADPFPRPASLEEAADAQGSREDSKWKLTLKEKGQFCAKFEA